MCDVQCITTGHHACLASLSVQAGIVRLDLCHLSSAGGFPPPPLSLQTAHALQFSLPQLCPPFHLRSICQLDTVNRAGCKFGRAGSMCGRAACKKDKAIPDLYMADCRFDTGYVIAMPVCQLLLQ